MLWRILLPSISTTFIPSRIPQLQFPRLSHAGSLTLSLQPTLDSSFLFHIKLEVLESLSASCSVTCVLLFGVYTFPIQAAACVLLLRCHLSGEHSPSLFFSCLVHAFVCVLLCSAA